MRVSDLGCFGKICLAFELHLGNNIVKKGSSSFHFDPSLSLTENYHWMNIKFKSDWSFK